jgi:hypothetical protein
LGKLFNPTNWEDFILPGSLLVGLAWLVSSSSEALLIPQISLLIIFLSISLIVRGLQAVPALAKAPAWLRPLYLGLTGGFAAWLAVQNMLLQPEFFPWVGLFVGGLGLGFLLLNPEESMEATKQNTPMTDARHIPSVLQSGLIALVLVGVATLVASRLFGTLGWVVLAVGLMVNRKAGSYVTVAALFLLGRVLLQTFLIQYSSNVTGINITHAYASAALYAGFAMMLLLPNLINTLYVKAPVAPQDTNALGEPGSNSLQPNFKPTLIALLGLGILLAAGFSNYFLHGEATASLLLALLVSGLGVGLLSQFTSIHARALPLLVTLLTLTGALASPEVLNWGNEAEKSQKLMVLGGVLVLVLLVGFLFQRIGSGRKLVQVS